jgi:hypothetical protein
MMAAPKRIGVRANLPTIEEIREALGIADSSQDAAIQSMFNSTIAIIEAYLQRGIVRADEIEEVDPPDSRLSALLLFRFPIESVATVTHDGLALTGFRVQKASGILRWPDGWARHRQCCRYDRQIIVSYTGGYADDAWPADLLDAVMSTFYRRWHATGGTGNAAEIDASASENRSVSIDGLTIEHRDPPQSVYAFGGALIPINIYLAPVAAQLEPYRVYRAGGV